MFYLCGSVHFSFIVCLHMYSIWRSSNTDLVGIPVKRRRVGIPVTVNSVTSLYRLQAMIWISITACHVLFCVQRIEARGGLIALLISWCLVLKYTNDMLNCWPSLFNLSFHVHYIKSYLFILKCQTSHNFVKLIHKGHLHDNPTWFFFKLKRGYRWGHYARFVVMVFNATNNISVISWRSVLLTKTGVPGENHRPAVSHWHTEYTSPWAGLESTTIVVIGTDCTCSCKSNYHTITTTTAPDTI